MTASPAFRSPASDVTSFMKSYYDAWSGTDEELILSYYADDVMLQIPGSRLEGKEAVRDQFVRPFITAFPGNWHRVKNLVDGPGVAVVEFTFEAEHKGPFAGHAATGARVVVPGCGVYQYDAATRQITAARIYFDVATLLQTITTFPPDDRGKAAEALRLNERSWNLIVNTIPTMAWTARPDGYCEFLNQRWLDYAGMTEEQATGWGWAEAIHPDDRTGLIDYWRSCLASGAAVEAEGRMRGFDGSYRWCLFRANPVRDESGSIVKWYGTNIDIDDRKKAEEALQASERNLSLTVNTIPTFIAVTRPDGFIVSVNQAALDYHGITLQDTQREDFRTRWYHPDDWPRLAEVLKEAFERQRPFEYEVRALSKEGQYRWFLVRCNPLFLEQERIDRWYITAFDIQDRKETEEALRKSERQFRLLVETMPALVWRSTPEGDLDYLNHRAVEYLGHTAESLAGGRWLELVHPDHREATLQRWLQSATTGTPYEDEYRLRRADGEYRWIRSVGEPFLDTEGRIANWYGVVYDIDDRKRADEALHRARSELAHMARITTLSALTASIAHEINQPISAAVLGAGACLRWLDRDQPDLQRAREAAKRVEEDGKRAADIITHLKWFYKKDVVPERERVGLNTVVGEMLSLLRSEAASHSVVMRTALAPDLPPVSADRVQLQQVLMNLMLNAMEAMDGRGGEVTIQTEREEGALRVSVSDTGAGIPADKIEDIFNAFVTTKAGGTGMGLPISRTIIESHGGQLWASPNPERGTTFHFTLPTDPGS